jgi:dTDP-4-dehydrorhamnose 3,5-epimerase
MRFVETSIPGVIRVEAEPHTDARGAFARLHCPEAFAAAGHPFTPAQTSLSRNPKRHTLRGLHYQPSPHAETKLVRVTRGRAFDVALDLRPESPTYRGWTSAELSAENLLALLIPEGVAHGFLTLEPDTDVVYQITPAFRPGHEAGVRWNDPAFGIAWPATPAMIGERDAGYPDYEG